MNNGLFRKVALERLSSPEELDGLLQVTSPKAWIALSGIGILIASVLAWSILGKLPTKVNAQQCILVKSGGVSVATASAAGRLSDLSVERGDWVVRGQIIGRIDQYDVLQKIKVAESRLKEAEVQLEQTKRIAEQSGKLRDVSFQQQTQAAMAQLAATHQKAGLLRERIKSQESLLDQGLITKQTLIASQLELTATELQAETVKSQIKQYEVTREDARNQGKNELTLANNQVEDVKRTIASLVREAKNSGLVVSPYAGRVLEVTATDGQLVDRGSPLVSIESVGGDRNEIEAYIYLPANDGKRVKAGMRTEISPSTARREEFGFLSANVASVAAYPSTDPGLMRVFGNEKLVQQLVGTTSPIQVVAALNPSSVSPSGYEWSTRKGPPFGIQSGTLCQASITLSTRHPITLAVPALKKFFGAE